MAIYIVSHALVDHTYGDLVGHTYIRKMADCVLNIVRHKQHQLPFCNVANIAYTLT